MGCRFSFIYCLTHLCTNKMILASKVAYSTKLLNGIFQFYEYRYLTRPVYYGRPEYTETCLQHVAMASNDCILLRRVLMIISLLMIITCTMPKGNLSKDFLKSSVFYEKASGPKYRTKTKSMKLGTWKDKQVYIRGIWWTNKPVKITGVLPTRGQWLTRRKSGETCSKRNCQFRCQITKFHDVKHF